MIRPRSALTLIEQLVVIAVMAVLLSISLPYLGAAREAARKLNCTSNLRQITLQLHSQVSEEKSLPENRFAFDGNDIASQERLWATRYLDFGSYKIETKRFVSTPAVLTCPSGPGVWVFEGSVAMFNGPALSEIKDTTADYVGNGGLGSSRNYKMELLPSARRGGLVADVIGDQRSRRLSEVTAGLSNTMYCWESSGYSLYRIAPGSGLIRSSNWPEGTNNAMKSDLEPTRIVHAKNVETCTRYFQSLNGRMVGYISLFDGTWSALGVKSGSLLTYRLINVTNSNGAPFSFHSSGANFGFGDGSVRFLSADTDHDVLMDQATLCVD